MEELRDNVELDDKKKHINKRHPEVLPLNATIDRRVNEIEDEISKINRTVHDKTVELERMTRQHKGQNNDFKLIFK